MYIGNMIEINRKKLTGYIWDKNGNDHKTRVEKVNKFYDDLKEYADKERKIDLNFLEKNKKY